jgi:hypothetical protein
MLPTMSTALAPSLFIAANAGVLVNNDRRQA